MNDAATMSDAREIVVDEVFPHTLDVVWKTLTTPAMIGRWLKMAPDGFQPTVGTRFTYQTRAAGEWDGVIRCEVLEVIPRQRLAYTWKSGHETNVGYGARLDTVVTFTLSAVEAGTRLRVVHAGFELPRNETAFKGMSEGWRDVVQRIDILSSEQD
jgi:uncharacterized protein YndB with AHSA1/START domain